ncbi:type 1 fimbrial protein [Citrobacter portucalensis]|uniref:Type 1 fimbrial protein n=1 Tax=Citrobacter portucalensis TaxID=1639133 RepID=A0AAW5WBU9_9ENTR|nr:fimbrial protein [Citrobacter portucalensis]MCX9004734.1 type 1 fimbrial protein [Citrobacter portucalensis]
MNSHLAQLQRFRLTTNSEVLMTLCKLLSLLSLGTIALWTIDSLASDHISRKHNMIFNGHLVAEPCTLEESQIDVEFETVIDRYLYINERTSPKKFSIGLKDCDTSSVNKLKIEFIAKENNFLPGLLSLDGGSQASGIGIGLETLDGKLLPFNKESVHMFHEGKNLLTFYAYIQGEPEALSQKTIGKGRFTATATFRISYD